MHGGFSTLTQKPKRFRAKPLADFDWRMHDLVRLEISVGQPYHEGAKLVAAMEWARAHFKTIVITLGDTLQRYNLMMDGMTPEQAWSESSRAGDEWLARNADIIGDATVIRWDAILSSAGYKAARAQLGILYENLTLIRLDVDAAIAEVAARRGISADQRDAFFTLSRDYMLEELAGTAIEERFFPGIGAYPGSLPSIWNSVNTIPKHLVPKGLESARTIELKLYKK